MKSLAEKQDALAEFQKAKKKLFECLGWKLVEKPLVTGQILQWYIDPNNGGVVCSEKDALHYVELDLLNELKNEKING